VKDKVIILGRGFVGKYLEQNLNQPAYSREMYDYHDPEVLRSMLGSKGLTTVINCCGFTGSPNIDECETEKEKTLYYNVGVPNTIQSVCDKYEHTRVIHIASGCIYQGDNNWLESDEPNFGLFNPSSYYSQSKHLFEWSMKDRGCFILRIRMPIVSFNHPKNYLNKIMEYPNLISEKNSITDLQLLSDYIKHILSNPNMFADWRRIYNVVNDEPITAKRVVELLREHNFNNPFWNFIDTEDLKTAAPRSNCTLSNQRLRDNGFLNIPTAEDAVERCIKDILS
tara:strand:- start:2912 stop:3757 length:846 start_codon:yes stop_codon:yes gene_type:complete